MRRCRCHWNEHNPFSIPQKGISVRIFIIVHFSIKKPWTPKNNMSNVHMDNITPNFVLIIANLEWYQTSISHGDNMTIRPCDLVGLRKLLNCPRKFVNDLLRDKIHCTTIVNNQISGLVFYSYPCVKFLDCLHSSSFFSFVLRSQQMTIVGLSSLRKSLSTIWALCQHCFLRDLLSICSTQMASKYASWPDLQ